MILEEGQTPPSRPPSAPRPAPPPSNASTFSLSPFPPRPSTTASSSGAYAHGQYQPLPSIEMYERNASPMEGYAYTGGSAFEQFPHLERGAALGTVGSWLSGRHARMRLVMIVAGASLVFLLHAHFFRPKHGPGGPPWARHGLPPPWLADELAAKAAEAGGAVGGRVPVPPPVPLELEEGMPVPMPGGGMRAVPPTAPARNPVGEIIQDQDEAEAVRFSQLPIADETPYILPRRKTPSSTQPWSHLPKAWIGHNLLSTRRFPTGNEAAGMHDPPSFLPPPSSFLDKAYEHAASANKPKLGFHTSVPEAVDARGRPLRVPRKDISLSGHGWRPVKLKVSELGTAKDKASSASWPKVQADEPLGPDRSAEEKARRDWVKRVFAHTWEGYKSSAWGHDELLPLGGEDDLNRTAKDPYNGWGATIVDCLDTLLIMGFEHEYNLAREHVRDVDFTYLTPSDPKAYSTELPPLAEMSPPPEKGADEADDGEGDGPVSWAHNIKLLGSVNFRSPTTIPTFETVIRYLGGLISAFDLAHDPLMLQRAVELADWILPALGTEYGLLDGGGRYVLGSNPKGRSSGRISLAETASLTLEFTRLSMLTGDEAYFQAVQRVTDVLDTHFEPAPEAGAPGASRGRLGALWPLFLDPDETELTGEFSIGAMADSAYEYLIKQAHLLGDAHKQYSRMYADAMDSVNQYLLKQIKTVPGRNDMALVGLARHGVFSHELQHLTCFAGGMYGLGAKLLHRPSDLTIGQNVTEACVFAYESTATGLGPEVIHFWGEKDRHRYKAMFDPRSGGRVRVPNGEPAGVKGMRPDHIGRPETIESVFYLWRITGDRKWQDKGWGMFVAWVEHALTPLGMADVEDVDEVPSVQTNGMQSFVLAETLKYYFLLFSPFDLISLDDYVLNTEAHPFARPTSGARDGKAAAAGVTSFWSGPDAGLEPAPSFVETGGEGTAVQKWYRVQQAHALVNLKERPPGVRGPGRAGRFEFVKPTREELDKAREGLEEKMRLLREKEEVEKEEAEEAEEVVVVDE